MKNGHVKSFDELNENKNLNISDVSDSKSQKKIWKNIVKEISDKGLNINNSTVLIKHLEDNYTLIKK